MTNGDKDGLSNGQIRQEEAVEAQTQHIGTNEDDLIFLGYPDGGLADIYDSYPNVTDSYVASQGTSETSAIASHGLGRTDYHMYAFGAHAKYNRPNIVQDLQSILAAYWPDEVYTTSDSTSTTTTGLRSGW